MRVLAKELERYGIVNFSGRFTRIIEGDEIGRFQRLLSDRIDVVMLSKIFNAIVRFHSSISGESYNTYLSQGMILVNSNTFPLPSLFREQTGLVNGWNVKSQQSNGV